LNAPIKGEPKRAKLSHPSAPKSDKTTVIITTFSLPTLQRDETDEGSQPGCKIGTHLRSFTHLT